MLELGTPDAACQSTFSPWTPANPWCKIEHNLLANEMTSEWKEKKEERINKMEEG